MPPSQIQPPIRYPQLDILRAIAIFLVLVRHKYGPFEVGFPLKQIYTVGWSGVDLFFVLSGFLVSGLLMKEWKQNKTVNVGRFLLRRGFRIYPAFYAFLCAEIFMLGYGGRMPTTLQMLNEALFLQNYRQGLPGASHTWSLAVEEHFYLILPLCFLMVNVLKNRFKKLSPIRWFGGREYLALR